MTVSFIPAKAIETLSKVPCESPSMGLTCTPTDRCGYCDDGYDTTFGYNSPTINTTNTNARMLFDALGLSLSGDGGLIPFQMIPSLLQKLMIKLSSPSVTIPQVVDHGVETTSIKVVDGMSRIVVEGQATLIHSENLGSRQDQRLREFQKLLSWSAQNQSDIQYN